MKTRTVISFVTSVLLDVIRPLKPTKTKAGVIGALVLICVNGYVFTLLFSNEAYSVPIPILIAPAISLLMLEVVGIYAVWGATIVVIEGASALKEYMKGKWRDAKAKEQAKEVE